MDYATEYKAKGVRFTECPICGGHDMRCMDVSSLEETTHTYCGKCQAHYYGKKGTTARWYRVSEWTALMEDGNEDNIDFETYTFKKEFMVGKKIALTNTGWHVVPEDYVRDTHPLGRKEL